MRVVGYISIFIGFGMVCTFFGIIAGEQLEKQKQQKIEVVET